MAQALASIERFREVLARAPLSSRRNSYLRLSPALPSSPVRTAESSSTIVSCLHLLSVTGGHPLQQKRC